MMRSSAPKALVEPRRRLLRDSILSRPSAGSSLSRLATVTRSWPSSRPAGDRPSAPLATAIISPCCTRALGDLDAAAGRLNLAEALRPGLRRKILQPAQHRGDVGIEPESAAAGCQYGAAAATSLSTISITGLSRTVPETMRPSISSVSALNRCSPAARAVDHRLVADAIETLSGDAGRPRTWSARAASWR